MSLPDFFIIGAPKAGTTALHAALTSHPGLFLSPVKEPKYFLCDGRPPRWRDHRGPGDAHSRREWVWRRDRYEALFAAAPPGSLRGESTSFYLWSRPAQRRLHELTPQARLVAVVRDPVDRAYSNWMHLRSDGLEREADFLAALHREPDRAARGWAPFWRYRDLGLYGEQLEDLFALFPREQVHVLRYRELVDTPDTALSAVHRFLGVAQVPSSRAPAENVKPYVPASPRNDRLRLLMRAGAAAGQLFPPQVWRRASVPLLRALYAGGTQRPALTVEQRREAVALFADDIELLGRVLDRSFEDWLSDAGRGSFSERRQPGTT